MIGTPVLRFSGVVATGGNNFWTFSPATTIQAGNTVVIPCTRAHGFLSTVSDSKGNTWHVDYVHDFNDPSLAFASSFITTPILTSDTITLTHTVTGNYITTAFVWEVSGLVTASPFDQGAFASGSGTAVSVGPTAALASANEIGFLSALNNDGSNAFWAPGSGWTGATVSTFLYGAYGLITSSSPLTITAAFGRDTVPPWWAVVGTYKGIVAANTDQLVAHPVGRLNR